MSFKEKHKHLVKDLFLGKIMRWSIFIMCWYFNWDLDWVEKLNVDEYVSRYRKFDCFLMKVGIFYILPDI